MLYGGERTAAAAGRHRLAAMTRMQSPTAEAVAAHSGGRGGG